MDQEMMQLKHELKEVVEKGQHILQKMEGSMAQRMYGMRSNQGGYSGNSGGYSGGQGGTMAIERIGCRGCNRDTHNRGCIHSSSHSSIRSRI